MLLTSYIGTLKIGAESLNHLDPIYDSQFETMSEHSGYWHSKSCHLNQSSKIIWDAWSKGGIYDSGDTYRMLMGMSFELLFKSFLIAKDIEIKATHNLYELAEIAGFTLEDKEIAIFTNLTGYIYWEGKYPVPKPIDTKRIKVTGGEGIKQQREPFIAVYSEGQDIFQEQADEPSQLTNSDLDYDNLLQLWKKFNDLYVEQYIAT